MGSLLRPLVVTASRDSEELHGCCDNAIGHFGVDVSIKDGYRQVVTGWWRSQRDNGQERWEEFRNMGLVGAAEAGAWSKEIWRAEDEDEDEEED